MTWRHVLLLWTALVTVAAYRQPFYPNYRATDDYPSYYTPSYYRKIDQRAVSTHASRDVREDMSLQRREDERDDTSPQRRVDEALDPAPVYEKNYRVSSERSIPFRANVQQVQNYEWDRVRSEDDSQMRNGNLTFKNFVKANPIVASRSGLPGNSDKVVFPGPISSSTVYDDLEIPTECQDKDFCVDVPNYPQAFVDNVLKENPELRYRFILDSEIPEIAQRRGPGEKNIELCQSDIQTIYPSAAKNIQGEWVLIINNKQHPVQGVKGEVCKKANKPCDSVTSFPRYKAMCKQRHVNRVMWSLHKVTGDPVMETVSVPSCCTCLLEVVSE